MPLYTLPDMPYDYSALEPHISGQIMELHHSKHQKAYVDGANTALEKLADARSKGEFPPAAINGLEKSLSFNLSGHVNHSIFWPNMSADGGDKPDGELASAIDEFFGGFDAFKTHFTAAATTIMGSGWAVLSWDPVGQRLNIEQRYDQQNQAAAGSYEVVMLDMWEHAFYLQYKNVKPDYVNAWWNVVNWQNAAERFGKAKSVSVL